LDPIDECCPSGQFAEGDEGDADLGAEEFVQERWRELLLDAQRGDVGVEDDTVHCSGDV